MGIITPQVVEYYRNFDLSWVQLQFQVTILVGASSVFASHVAMISDPLMFPCIVARIYDNQQLLSILVPLHETLKVAFWNVYALYLFIK